LDISIWSKDEGGLGNADGYTVELSGTKLVTLPPLVLGGIIENQNSGFVMT
jgi:hypothetical protein